MKYMLDTNILIYLIKNQPPSVATRISELDDEATLCMSFFTYAELLKGAERRNRKNEVLRSLTRHIQVQYTTNKALCEHYAAQFTVLKEAGTPIGANDLWIACHALAENCILVTNNTREFSMLQGLVVEDWG